VTGTLETGAEPAPDSDLIARLGLNKIGPQGLTRWQWLAIGGGVFVLLFIVLPLVFGSRQPGYVMQKISRGPLAVTVSATGTLAPRDQVDVGAEVSGRIDALAVDFNDHVKKGQILARINTDQLRAQLAQAQATLAQAEATYRQDSESIRRDRALVRNNAMSAEAFNLAQGDFNRARAGVDLARAQVDQDNTMISKATVHSPINGVVLDRKVSAGQTVVAAMTTPVLFTLASDLSQMELNVDIDEADVGQIRTGAQATFTVDAYPSRKFKATLISIHNAPQTVQGVVTYQGVLLVSNPEHLLKPGMTATAEIQAANVRNALLIPNGALRFVPPDEIKLTAPPVPASENGVNWGRVWVSNDGKLVPHDVKLGPTDGRVTVMLSGDLKPGDTIIVDQQRPSTQPQPRGVFVGG
jgi:HlyD family secretion protein